MKKFYGKFIDVRSHEEYEEKYHALKKIMILILFSIIYSIGCITQPITFAASTSHSSYKINRYSKPIPIEQLKIGGVGIGDSLDYVKSIYGEPSIVGKRSRIIYMRG